MAKAFAVNPDMKLKSLFPKISIDGSIAVLRLYWQILKHFPLSSCFLIFAGFVSRVFSILVFVLILKVFLSILDASSPIFEVLRSYLFRFSIEVNTDSIPIFLVLILTFVIFFQFILNKLCLKQFVRTRNDIADHLLARQLNPNIKVHLHIAFDHILTGYDSFIKSCEILLFYFFLFLAILYLNWLLGLLVLISVPLLVVVLVLKGRKQVFLLQEARKARENYRSIEEEVQPIVEITNEHYTLLRNSIVHSEFGGGLAIVGIMVIYLVLFDSSTLNGLGALFLVFLIRFAIVFAGELSRLTGRLLQSRTIIDDIDTIFNEKS